MVSKSHLAALFNEALSDAAVIASKSEAVLMPPAIFKRDVFGALVEQQGDRGARALFQSVTNISTVAIPKEMAVDIDTPADLTADAPEH